MGDAILGRSWIGTVLAVWSLSGWFVAGAFAHPASGIVVNAQGEVFFVHTRHGVCKIDAQGQLTYVRKVTGGHFLAPDPEERFSSAVYPRLFRKITPSGVKPALLYGDGAPFVVNRDGNLYYGSGYPEGDDMTPGFHTLTRLSPDGKRTLFAPRLKTKLAELHEGVTGLAAGPDGTLFVACPNAVLKVQTDGTVTTFLHPVVVTDRDDDLAKDSHTRAFHSPYLRGLDSTPDGFVYAAVTGCRCVIKITPGGKVETILKAEKPWTPTGVAVQGKDIFVLEYVHSDNPKDWVPRVRKWGPGGKVAILADLAQDDKKPEPRTNSFRGSKAGDTREVAGVKLCWCPPGRFRMGSPSDEPERRPDEAQVEVTLTKGFWMGKYEVTQGQWKRVVGKLPGERTAAGGEGDDFPVYNVTYPEAEAFCRQLTERGRQSGNLPKGWEFRLPTEAQWEYACRAGTRTATSFGDQLSSKQANFQGKPYNGAEQGPSLNRATKVGSYPANAWGLHDMHGNVYEWCRDWYHLQLPGGDDPDLSARKGAMNRDGTFSRVRRGGAWCDDGQPCRSARRLRYEPERRSDHIGFRVAVVPH
jgi:formylglycine-generating enzyme required for sulfatase activity